MLVLHRKMMLRYTFVFVSIFLSHVCISMIDGALCAVHMKYRSITNEESMRNFLGLRSHHKTAMTQKHKEELDDVEELDFKMVDSKSVLVTEIKVGTPAETFSVVLDTGSSNFWLVSNEADDSNLKMKKFDPKASTTFENSQDSTEWDIEFGAGAVSLRLGKDTVKLNDIETLGQDMGLAFQLSGSVFYTGSYSGILGLGYPALAAEGTLPVFDRIMRENPEFSSFAFAMSHKKLLIGDVEGEESRGLYYENDVHFSPVIEKYYWEVKLDDILIDGKSSDLCTNGCGAIVDTGTTFNTFPSFTFAEILNLLSEGDSEHLYDCDRFKNLTYVIGQKEYTLTPYDYLLFKPNQAGAKEACAPRLMQMDVSKSKKAPYLLGEVFLTKFYTIFDRENDRIGFAHATQPHERSVSDYPDILRFN